MCNKGLTLFQIFLPHLQGLIPQLMQRNIAYKRYISNCRRMLYVFVSYYLGYND